MDHPLVPDDLGGARLGAVLGGAALVGFALARRSAPGFLLGLLGADALRWGLTEESVLLRTAGELSGPTSVRRRILVDRPAEEVFRAWRDLASLPRALRHLESVEELGDGRSRWVARGPGGVSLEWTAELTREEPGRALSWMSTGGELETYGSVELERAAGDRGTVLELFLVLAPPAGRAGLAVAWLLGRDPRRTIDADLRRFKALVEAGETPTIEGQPSGPGDRWTLGSVI